MNYRSKIAGIGTYLPSNVVKNDDLTKWMDTSNEWILQRTGIRQRHWTDTEESSSDLGLVSSERALENAGIGKEDLDMIIFATLSPDHEFPGTACFLQKKLDLPGVPALDVRQQCTGFIYGLSIADQFIRSGMYKNILLTGAEVHSRGLDRTTRGRDVAVLFGDGAGSVVVSRAEVSDTSKDSHILSTHLHADGNYATELWVKAPGLAYGGERLTHEVIERCEHFPEMNGKSVFVHAVRRMPEVLMEALRSNNLSIEDIDLFVFHQANLRINEKVAAVLKIPSERVFNTIDRFGNTTAATIPLGLSEAEKAGKLKKGMLVASAAFGSGFTWASSVIRW